MNQFLSLFPALVVSSLMGLQAPAGVPAKVIDLITCQESLAYYQDKPRLFFQIYIFSSPLDPLGSSRTLAAMFFVEYDGQREMVLSQSGSPEHVLTYLGAQDSHQLSLNWVHPASAFRGQIHLQPQTKGRFVKEFTGIYHGSFEAEGLFGDLKVSRPLSSGRPGVVCTADLAQ